MIISDPLLENLFTLFIGCLTLFPKYNIYDLVCSSTANLLQVELMPNINRLTVYGRMRFPDILRKEHVKNFTQIKIFIVHYGVNDIEDEALHGLKNLTTIYLGNCNIPVIKATFFDNPNLERFIFKESNVTDIEPKAFSKLPSLKDATISKNKIPVIRKGIFDNTPLEKLYLEHNQIETIEEGAFAGMINLRILKLNNNLLKTFNSELIIGESVSLARFDLSINKLTEITNSMTRTLPNLNSFNLMHNSIKKIQCCSFKHLGRLEYLYLSYNQIEELEPSLFDEKNNITNLTMKRNKISCISEQFLKKLPHLTYVEASENPWEPTCRNSTRTYFSQHEIEDECLNFEWVVQYSCVTYDCSQHKSKVETIMKNYCL